MTQSSDTKTGLEPGTRFTQRFLDDLRDTRLPQHIRRDFQDTYRFFLDDDERARLDAMGTFKRSLFSSGYLIRSLVLKLSPARRLMLLLGIVLVIIGMPAETAQIAFGVLLLLFVLGLELKDKLLAKDELAEGRAVQIALMPTEHPSLPGWETWLFSAPANDVGGDLVDHLRLDEEHIALTLGDVAGKGLPAALMMAKLQATLRALSPVTDSLSELGSRLNRIVCRDGLPSKFASLVYLELEANAPRLRMLNAGHLPPLVIRKGAVEELEHGDAAIGIMDAANFRERTVEMAPGDLMLVYSDGLTEARNEIGRFFGEERLYDLLDRLRDISARGVGENLLRAVDRFENGARRHDDLSMIIVRRLKES
jgi:hypothetical protein